VEAKAVSRQSTKRLKGRKLSDTLSSWRQLDYALAQERKKDEDDSDDEDSEKKCEKMMKKGITCTPSSMPSTRPSFAPTVSQAPTLSNRPSVSPSHSPTRAPSRAPSVSPSKQPSVSPTNYPTGQPSVSPTIMPTTLAPTVTPFASLVLSRDDGSLWQDNTCQTSLPSGATKPQSQETRFEYFIAVTASSDATSSMQQVEQALNTALADEILSCVFDASSPVHPFETFGITSLPLDELASGSDASVCPESAQIEGADCYAIRGGFTPTIFFLSSGGGRRRQLSFSAQSESDVVQVFGPILQKLLDSDMFIGGNVLGTAYSGFLAGNGVGSTTSGSDILTGFTNSSFSAIQGQSSVAQADNDGGQTGFIIGAIVICLSMIALIVVSAVILQRRKRAWHKENFDEVGEGSANFDVDAESVVDPNKYDTRNVLQLQEGPPGEKTHYIYTGEGPPPNDLESVQSASYVTGRFEGTDVSLVEARRAVAGLNYGVVNDDATYEESLFDVVSDDGTDNHDYENCRSATCFKCRFRKAPQITFVQADLQAIQSDLGRDKQYRPKHDRQYHSGDTVDL